MKVSEAIKSINHYVIVCSRGIVSFGILVINNGNGMCLRKNPIFSEDEILDMNVLEIKKGQGLYNDYWTIRV